MTQDPIQRRVIISRQYSLASVSYQPICQQRQKIPWGVNYVAHNDNVTEIHLIPLINNLAGKIYR